MSGDGGPGSAFLLWACGVVFLLALWWGVGGVFFRFCFYWARSFWIRYCGKLGPLRGSGVEFLGLLYEEKGGGINFYDDH